MWIFGVFFSFTEQSFPFFFGKPRFLSERCRYVDLDDTTAGTIVYTVVSRMTDFVDFVVIIVLIIIGAGSNAAPPVLALDWCTWKQRLPLINVAGLCHSSGTPINRSFCVPLVSLPTGQWSIETSVITVKTRGLVVQYHPAKHTVTWC